MFSEKALFDTQVDLAKAGTVASTSQLLNSYRKGGEYFPMAWVYATVATLVGFVVHGLIVSQVIKPNTGNMSVDSGLSDVVKVGTVLLVAEAINTGMRGDVELSESWMMSTGITLAAFFAFHVVVAPYIPSVEGHQATVMDVAKAGFTTVIAHYMAGGAMDNEFMLSLAGTLAGFAVFHEVVAPRVFA
jgi:hypothetical protein